MVVFVGLMSLVGGLPLGLPVLVWFVATLIGFCMLFKIYSAAVFIWGGWFWGGFMGVVTGFGWVVGMFGIARVLGR